MRSIDEGYLRFEFDSVWDHIERWDDSRAFIEGIHKVEGVRALDIVALSRTNKECLLLEIKDFRDQNAKQRSEAIRPSEAQIAQKLAEQVAQKLAGTVAGLVGAARMRDEAFAKELAQVLAADRSGGFKVRVVLWVEGQPTSKGMSPRSVVNLSTLTQALKRQVAWLTERPVQVLSTASPKIIPGLRVIDSRP